MGKRRLLFLSALALFSGPIAGKASCELSVNPEWTHLDDITREKQFGTRWVLVATLTFKRCSKEFITLDELELAWQGKQLESLTASLFKRDRNNPLIPLQQNLICDGCWNRLEQRLHFKFQDKEYLQPTSIFCIALTVPTQMEKDLREGYFEILPHTLPRQLQASLKNNRMRITMLADSSNRASKRRRLSNRTVLS